MCLNSTKRICCDNCENGTLSLGLLHTHTPTLIRLKRMPKTNDSGRGKKPTTTISTMQWWRWRRRKKPHTRTLIRGTITIQIGCCGADGSNDYITMRQPLPSTCRDTVTGNAFFHGCVDELTWLLEDKSGWVAGLAMTLAFIHVCIWFSDEKCCILFPHLFMGWTEQKRHSLTHHYFLWMVRRSQEFFFI